MREFTNLSSVGVTVNLDSEHYMVIDFEWFLATCCIDMFMMVGMAFVCKMLENVIHFFVT